MQDNNQEILDKTKALFDKMHAAYDVVADNYGFSCEGCTDNCCVQRFFHHTHVEYQLLRAGMATLEPEVRDRIISRANMTVMSYMKELEAGELLPMMCPANIDGKCAVYEWRPMMCRLHGMPFRAPSRDGEKLGEGCARFSALHPDSVIRVDRKLFYPELAQLEMQFRMQNNLGGGKYVKTTAEMIVDMAGDFEPADAEDEA